MEPLGIEGATEGSDVSAGKLFAYQGGVQKGVILLTVLLPHAVVGYLIYVAGTSADSDRPLEVSIPISGLLRFALTAHGLYFIILPFWFELAVEKLPMGFEMPGLGEDTFFGKMPERSDNLFWMLTCLAGELFFVAAVLVLLMAWVTEVPRWTLIVVMAQCAYNMKNSLIWCFLGNVFSPIKKRVTFMFLDWASIAAFFLIYLLAFFGRL